MKFKSTITAGLLTIGALLSVPSTAATDTPADSNMEKPAAKKKMAPHDHTQDRTGIRTNSPKDKPKQTTGNQVSPANDKTKHFHPRDK